MGLPIKKRKLGELHMFKKEYLERYLEAIRELKIENRYGYLLGKESNNAIFEMALTFAKILGENKKLEHLLNKLEFETRETYLHSIDVYTLMYLLNPNATMTVLRGSLFHDIGKLKTPKEILGKNGKLTDIEFEIMKDHTKSGAWILESLGYYEEAKIALFHHEHIDGTGYFGLAEEEMNESLKLISIVDVYSALTLERSYKKPFTNQKAFETLGTSKESFDMFLLEGFKEKCLI